MNIFRKEVDTRNLMRHYKTSTKVLLESLTLQKSIFHRRFRVIYSMIVIGFIIKSFLLFTDYIEIDYIRKMYKFDVHNIIRFWTNMYRFLLWILGKMKNEVNTFTKRMNILFSNRIYHFSLSLSQYFRSCFNSNILQASPLVHC